MSLLSMSRRTHTAPTTLTDEPALELAEALLMLESFACPTGEHDYCTHEAVHRAHLRSVSPVCDHHPVMTCPTCQ